ncbi:MAG: hypothetical protein HWN80_02625 [Candidatus Lokiarchaeota archaeon]|nr:hypothetical protein [Candidatus Lokiarchaeota archaeon]
MKKLEVRCPSCSSRGYIEVSETEVEKAARGVFAVNVLEGVACEHSFVAYVDKNLAVRDTFIADFQIELPDVVTDQVIEPDVSEQLELIDVGLIKLNFTASLLTHIIRGILFRKKIILLFDQSFMVDNIYKFIEYITLNSFKPDLFVVTGEQYDMKVIKEAVILEGNIIIKDDDNILNPKTLGVERSLVRKFLAEYEPKPSLIYLQNGLQKAYELSLTIVEIVKNLKKKEKLYSKNIIEDLVRIHNVKVQLPYLDFLYEIVENYFEVKVPKSSNISNFLSTL